ncbi:MAG: hypothetical protein II879_06715, partial [Clostridia bacterium]|nr:hypothetical protein [Clostridia bacterium]
MKRKLWIMVAITALMMGLWYTAKAADGSLPAFTKQPQNATIAWNGFCKVTWDTNYPPVSAQVQYHNISNNGWETYSDPYYLVGGQIAEDKLSANFHYNDYLKGK